VICTSRRATVVVVTLSLGALTFSVIEWNFQGIKFWLIKYIKKIVFLVVLPVTVFIVNMVVLCQVRRASNSAAVNLGLQQHHQSTSSNSAVPTVMLITTSLLYVLLTAPFGFLYVFLLELPDSAWCSETWRTTLKQCGSHPTYIRLSSPTTSLFTSLPANSFAASCVNFVLVVVLLTTMYLLLLSEPCHTVKLSPASNNARLYSTIREYSTPINQL